jgi:hypothetical protein
MMSSGESVALPDGRTMTRDELVLEAIRHEGTI